MEKHEMRGSFTLLETPPQVSFSSFDLINFDWILFYFLFFTESLFCAK